MKKIMNAPEAYVDDMLKGIYEANGDMVKYAADDLRCYCTAKKKDGKVAIITGGGSGHLPLFLGYVGEGLIDGCGVGGVFQSPSPEQIANIAKEVEAGAGVLFKINMNNYYMLLKVDASAHAAVINSFSKEEINGEATNVIGAAYIDPYLLGMRFNTDATVKLTFLFPLKKQLKGACMKWGEYD